MVSKEWLEETYGQERYFEFMQYSACENMEMYRLKSQDLFFPRLYSQEEAWILNCLVSRVCFSFDVAKSLCLLIF